MLGEDITETAWIYALSAHMYNNGDYLLSDPEYDQLTNVLTVRWRELPKELKDIFVSPEDIRNTGMHIFLDPIQLNTAKEVYRNYEDKKSEL